MVMPRSRHDTITYDHGSETNVNGCHSYFDNFYISNLPRQINKKGRRLFIPIDYKSKCLELASMRVDCFLNACFVYTKA